MCTQYSRVCLFLAFLVLVPMYNPVSAQQREVSKEQALSIYETISQKHAQEDLLELLNYYDALRNSKDTCIIKDINDILWTLDRIEALYGGNNPQSIFDIESMKSLRTRIQDQKAKLLSRQVSANLKSIYEVSDEQEKKKELTKQEIEKILECSEIELRLTPCSVILSESDQGHDFLENSVIVEESQNWEEIIIEGTANFMMDRAKRSFMLSFFNRLYTSDIYETKDFFEEYFPDTYGYFVELEKSSKKKKEDEDKPKGKVLRELPDFEILNEYFYRDLNYCMGKIIKDGFGNGSDSANENDIKDAWQMIEIVIDFLEGKSISAALFKGAQGIEDPALKEWLNLISYLYEVNLDDFPTRNRCDILSLAIMKYADSNKVTALHKTDEFFDPKNLLELNYLMNQIVETTRKINAEIKAENIKPKRICDLSIDLSNDLIRLITYSKGIKLFEASETREITQYLEKLKQFASDLSMFSACLKSQDYLRCVRQIVVMMDKLEINGMNKDLQRTIEVLAAFSEVQDASQVQVVYEQYALPEASFLAKRNTKQNENKRFGCYINGYLGAVAATERVISPVSKGDRWYYTFGVSAPIGLEFTYHGANWFNIGFLISALDLGTFCQVKGLGEYDRVSDQDWKFSSVFAPGVFAVYAWPDVALSLAGGYQVIPNYRQVDGHTDVDATRICFFAALDIPMFRLY